MHARKLPLAGVVLTALPAAAQIPTALAREAEQLPGAGAGHVVSSFSSTCANRVGGHSATVTTSDGTTTLSHVWGHATGGAGAPLVTESNNVAGYNQTGFEAWFGMSDAGNAATSPTCTEISTGTTGLDTAWLDQTPIAVEGQPIMTLPGFVFRFNSRVGVTCAGEIYWIGGINQGTTNMGQGLFRGAGQICVMRTGDPAPAPLTSTLGSSAIGFDTRMSADGTHFIGDIDTTDATSMDAHVVIDGQLAMSTGGTPLSEGTLVPVVSGGNGTELWGPAWGFFGINEAGDWMVTGNTNGPAATNSFIVRNGAIWRREGDVVAGLTLTGAALSASMNEAGGIAFSWNTNMGEALFYEDTLLAKVGDLVDWDGDGVLDAGHTISDLNGSSPVTTGIDGPGGAPYVLFLADVVNPTPPTPRQGFFRIDIPAAGEPFCAGDGVDPAVTTLCPCGNFGGAGRGCAHSANPSGALLSASGSTGGDSVVLAASDMPATSSCIYLQGDALGDAVFGDGVRCTDGNLIRLRTRQNVAGASTFPDSTDTITLSQRGGVTVGSGAVRYYQTYYRNAAALFCPPETFNVTNGWRVTW